MPGSELSSYVKPKQAETVRGKGSRGAFKGFKGLKEGFKGGLKGTGEDRTSECVDGVAWWIMVIDPLRFGKQILVLKLKAGWQALVPECAAFFSPSS